MELAGTLADREYLDLRSELLERMNEFVELVLKRLLEKDIYIEQHVWDEADDDGSLERRAYGLVMGHALLQLNKKVYGIPARQPVWLVHLVEITQTPPMLQSHVSPDRYKQGYPMPDFTSLPSPLRGYNLWLVVARETVDALSFILHSLMVGTETMYRRASARGVQPFECNDRTWRLLTGLALAVWQHMEGLTLKRFEDYEPQHVEFFQRHSAVYSFNRLVLRWLEACRVQTAPALGRA